MCHCVGLNQLLSSRNICGTQYSWLTISNLVKKQREINNAGNMPTLLLT